MTVELAMWTVDSWELIGDYASAEAAEAAARENGAGLYGISADPLSGHYEEFIEAG